MSENVMRCPRWFGHRLIAVLACASLVALAAPGCDDGTAENNGTPACPDGPTAPTGQACSTNEQVCSYGGGACGDGVTVICLAGIWVERMMDADACVGGDAVDGSGGDTNTAEDTKGLFDTGASPPPKQCIRSDECTLTYRSCCGNCGQPTESDHIALNASGLSQYQSSKSLCGDCPQCSLPDDAALRAVCSEQGTCEPLIVPTSTYSECTQDSQCLLRWGDCCKPCSGGTEFDVVSVHIDQSDAYTADVCRGGVICDTCQAQQLPTGISSRCEDGHCVVVR